MDNLFDEIFDNPEGVTTDFWVNINPTVQTQLDRIEAKLDKLLAPKKRKPRASKSEYPEWFEEIWQVYPKRAGSNPKNHAYSSARKRNDEYLDDSPFNSMMENENAEIIRMYDGVIRYRRFCKATNKLNTETVMQAQRFFGTSREYTNDWTIPKPKEKNGQPEIFSQSHQDADFSGQAEKALDPVDMYKDLR